MHEGSHEYVSLKNEGDKMIVAEKVSGFAFDFHIKWLCFLLAKAIFVCSDLLLHARMDQCV